MRTRLVTFLGLGNKDLAPNYYHPARYLLDGTKYPDAPTTQHDAATLLAMTPESVLVLGTEEVLVRWFDEQRLYETELSRHVKDREAVAFSLLPPGKTEEERWRLFQVVLDSLRPEAMTWRAPGGDEVREAEPPQRIVLDVTHGFRSQPFLAAAALAFAQSAWRREQVDSPEVRILYAAFEARQEDDGVALVPVWDLSQFLEALEWTTAIDTLMRFGRADDLERLGRLHSKRSTQEAKRSGRTGRELSLEQFPRRLGMAARAFADDLAFCRAHSLLTQTAPQLAERVSPEAEDEKAVITQWKSRLPPVGPVIDELGQWLKPLIARKRVFSRSGLMATLQVATLCQKLHRFAESAVALREALVTHYALLRNHQQTDMADPTHTGCKISRDALEAEWKRDTTRLRQASAVHGSSRSEEKLLPVSRTLRRNLELSDQITQIRNDILHMGLRDHPVSALRLREGFEEHITAVREMLTPDTAMDRFVNISNHPMATWSEDQVIAARKLGHGLVVDLEGGMPLVEPDANTADLASLAAEIANRAIAQGATGAYVATDFVLTQLVVIELQRRGVPCYSATTERKTRESQLPGGATERRSVFRFIQWRPYGNPLLAGRS